MADDPTTKGPVTIERIESAMDTVALAMHHSRDGGETYLPIYQRLERELAELHAKQASMESARSRCIRLGIANPRLKRF